MQSVIIETDRLLLREMSLSDIETLSSILQDENVMYAYNGAFSDEETLAWMQKQLQRYRVYGFGLWGVFLKDTGEMIGQCGITMQEYNGGQVPEIGYLLAHKYWHKGYATEAAAACREYGFDVLHFDALYSIIRDTNTASQNVALRNGMTLTDTIVKHYRGVDMPHMVFCVRKDDAKSNNNNKNTKEIEMQSNPDKIFPRTGDTQTVYLKSVVTRKTIEVGDFTIYNDFVNDPRDFEKNNVLYHYPINGDRLVIGKFCSIACGAKFIFNCANHALRSLSTYTFPLFFEEWDLSKSEVASAWDNKGDIIIGNDVWIGYDAVIMAGVTIGDGAIIGTRAVVTKDVAPYSIVGGVPAREIRKRFAPEVVERLRELQWWDWPEEKIRKAIPAIQAGDVEALK